MQRHEDTLNAVRATAQEQVHFNVQGVSLRSFILCPRADRCPAVSGRVQQGARVRSAHAARRGRQAPRGEARAAVVRRSRTLLHCTADPSHSEIGCLLTLKSKYGPGGEFDPDWRPETGPCAADGTRMPAPAPAEADAPGMPEDAIPARPGWRTVTQRTSRRSRRRETTGAPAPPPPPPPAPEQRPPVSSWATWQRECALIECVCKVLIDVRSGSRLRAHAA
jgi:hypothetical protein